MQGHSALLRSHGAAEVAQLPVTHPSVVEGGCVDGCVREIVERQHALEPGQCLAVVAANDESHAKVVEREHLAVTIVPFSGAGHRALEPGLGLVRSSEAEKNLAGQNAGIDAHVVGIRRQRLRRVSRDQSVCELAASHVKPRADIAIARAQPGEALGVGKLRLEKTAGAFQVGLADQDFGSEETRLVCPQRSRHGIQRRLDAIDGRQGLVDGAAAHRLPRRFERLLDFPV